MRSSHPDRDYYRRLYRTADSFRVDLITKRWCDLWHVHFDWNGFGNLNRVHRLKHLNVVLRALDRARRELAGTTQPYQLFAIVYPRSSIDDAVYVHTENPNGTEFPLRFSGAVPIDTLPPLLAGRVNLKLYSVLKQRHDEGDVSFIIEVRGGTKCNAPS